MTLIPKRTVGDLLFSTPRPAVVDGRFVAAGLTPGTYVVTARGRAAGPAATPPAGRGAAPASSWAMSEVVVSGQDVSGVEMRLEPAQPVTGRMVFESATGQTPANMNGYRASMNAWRSGTGPTVSISMPSAPADAEGKFRFASVVPGTYAVNGYGPALAAQARTWVLKSVTANGRDVTDQPLDIRPREQPPEIVVTFTDKVTEVAGTVFDGTGRPTSGLTIIIFTARRELWTQGSRHVRPATAATDGTFTFKGMPPGDYLMAAVTEYEYTDLADASFLEQLAAGAFKITLTEGEKKVQDIKLGK